MPRKTRGYVGPITSVSLSAADAKVTSAKQAIAVLNRHMKRKKMSGQAALVDILLNSPPKKITETAILTEEPVTPAPSQ